MKRYRMLVVAALAGVFICASGNKASAQYNPGQDLVSSLIYGLVLGNTPYGSYGGPAYGGPAYDPRYTGRGGYAEPPYSPFPFGFGRDQDDRYSYEERGDRLDRKYDKAMRRLDRQEYEARQKAARKYRGERKYSEKMAKIDRKYDHKRWKVERNTAQDYRKLDNRFEDDYYGGGLPYGPLY